MNAVKIFSVLVLFSCTLFAQDYLTSGKDALSKKRYDEAVAYFTLYNKANSRTAESNYWLGEAYRQKEMYDSALYWLDRSLDFDDESEAALASVVYVNGKLGLWSKAQKRYDAAIKYHKKSILAPTLFAQVYLEADSLDKASIYFSKLKELDNNNIDAYIGLAEVYARQNVIVLAVDNLRTAVSLKPNDAALHYRLASTILKNRSLDKNMIEEVLTHLNQSIELDPTNERAIFDAANTLYRIAINTPKFYADAAQYFKKYIALNKSNSEVWEKYAISLYYARVYGDAAPALEQAIAMNPKTFELKPMLAHSYYVEKEYKKALDKYNSLPVDSLDKDAYYRMGYSYFQLKDTLNAMKNLEKSLSLDSTNIDAIGTLAFIYLSQKNYGKAATSYEIIIKNEPENLTALFYAGFSYSVLGKIDTAKNYFKRLITLKPSYIPARMYLANMYSLMDSVEQSKTNYTIVIEQSDSLLKANPKKADSYTSNMISSYRALAIFSYKENDIQKAIALLLQAVELENKAKQDEGLHLFLAQMYAVKSGDQHISADEAKSYRQKACQEYLFVLKLNPKNAAAKKESAQMNCGK